MHCQKVWVQAPSASHGLACSARQTSPCVALVADVCTSCGAEQVDLDALVLWLGAGHE